jgi:hypothetical protein
VNTKLFSFILIIAAFMFCLTASFAADEKPSPNFVPDQHPEILEVLNAHESAAGVADALADSGANWPELWGALESLDGVLWSHACWLITNMPHLDRIEITRNTLLEHVRFAYATKKDLPYKVPDSLFQEYILAYRIGDEPVRPYRSFIWFKYPELKGKTMIETARNINNWVKKNLTVRERGFFGPRPDPAAIIAAGTGTQTDIATVAVAMCKTFGVAARQARVSVLGEKKGGYSWLEIYTDDGRWIPMYPDAPEAFGHTGHVEHLLPHNVTVVASSTGFKDILVTPTYTETGTLELQFKQNGEPVTDFQHFSINAWNNGAWLPLDDIDFSSPDAQLPKEDGGGYKAVLGDGAYLVEAGVRNGRGDAYVQTFPITIKPGSTMDLIVNLDIPANKLEAVDLVSRTIEPLPYIQLDYNTPVDPGFYFPKNLATGAYVLVILFDPQEDASKKMIPLVSLWAKSQNINVYAVGVGSPDVGADLWKEMTGLDPAQGPFFADPNGTIANAFGYKADDKGKYANLPMLLMMSPDGKIVYLRDGYSLLTADYLSRAKELSEKAG